MQTDPNIYFIKKKYDNPYVKRNNAFLVYRSVSFACQIKSLLKKT